MDNLKKILQELEKREAEEVTRRSVLHRAQRAMKADLGSTKKTSSSPSPAWAKALLENPVARATFKLQGMIALAGATLLGSALVLATSTLGEANQPQQAWVMDQVQLPAPAAVLAPTDAIYRTERVQRGDTLNAVLNRLGVNDPAFVRLVRSHPEARILQSPRAGRYVSARLSADNKVLSFDVLSERSAASAVQLKIDRKEDGTFEVTETTVPIEKQVETKFAEVRYTFFGATDAAEIPDAVAIQIADIFGTEIDFNRELRKGDTIKVVYESLKLPSSLENAVPGRVLAVQVNHRGRQYDAQWFERSGGTGEYFSSNGLSRKKAFLRTPLEVSRVTSGFTSARLNPFSRTWSAHKGVDFAAPIGTYIRASASGVVHFVGVQSGYGKVVVIKHGTRFETLYAHMDQFTDGLVVGRKVNQGDIIGTVGMTGFSTGPHLHYEFKVDGEHVDPLSAALPIAEPLTTAEQRRFAQVSGAYQSKLATAVLSKSAGFE